MKQIILTLVLYSLSGIVVANTPIFGRILNVDNAGVATIKINGEEKRFAFANILLPDQDNPFRATSLEVIRAQSQGQLFTVVETNKAPDGVPTALFYYNGHPFNADLVKRGFAWVDLRQTRSSGWLRYQSDARVNRLGMFKENAQPEPPKRLRVTQKKQNEPKAPLADRLKEMDRMVSENSHKILLAFPSNMTYWPMSCMEPIKQLLKETPRYFVSEHGVKGAGYKKGETCTLRKNRSILSIPQDAINGRLQ